MGCDYQVYIKSFVMIYLLWMYSTDEIREVCSNHTVDALSIGRSLAATCLILLSWEIVATNLDRVYLFLNQIYSYIM